MQPKGYLWSESPDEWQISHRFLELGFSMVVQKPSRSELQLFCINSLTCSFFKDVTQGSMYIPIGSMYGILWVTFTTNIPPMLPYIAYMVPMGYASALGSSSLFGGSPQQYQAWQRGFPSQPHVTNWWYTNPLEKI